MLQATKNKYTVETLKPLNILYDHEHWLTQQDVDMANGYVELIERTRSEKTPQIGDRLIYVDRYGKYYGNALIENNDEESGRISISEEPYIPFVWEQDANIRLSVSGGAFHHIDPKQLKFVRWTEGAFKDWETAERVPTVPSHSRQECRYGPIPNLTLSTAISPRKHGDSII